MAYAVKEIFYTLQGEGRNAGRAAVFCRFAGCNLWSGREEDRASAACQFCDTDFVGAAGAGGGRFRDAASLAAAVEAAWPRAGLGRFVVLTGGEPLLQVDNSLLVELHARRFEVAVETNGTLDIPSGVDWVCVSPKGNAPLTVTRGDELKLVYPQKGAEPERFETMQFSYHLLQPMDGPSRAANTAAAVAYCLANPRWRLTIQTHKVLGIP
ncbi:7-carboxy-7-deazaguanine synthase [Pararoseomonas indoligenes]|uniref:7-carboxy-7-deazaguanine synthase n=1 Tax=Roseomonas indoligenes TaxID=2820811 RepID=A0A940N912_9PROT|nr:7-carboxy-7-deazaguanine synthase [Pararoseomonas indoligenes]MBP0496267.1 7-carboxy-7-deazaguanine synthase [Pararoseomonas indoligenes]